MNQKGGFSLISPSSKKLADLLTKAAPKVFFVLYSKLGMVDIYAPA